MRAAIAVDSTSLTGLLSSLVQRRSAEPWTDLATAAEAASATQDAMAVLLSSQSDAGRVTDQLRASVDDLIYSAIVELQDALDRSDYRVDGSPYPWDGKASTAVKCLEAWLKFDGSLDLPVYEVADVLTSAADRATSVASGDTALAVLEELRVENQQLSKQYSDVSERAALLPKLRQQSRAATLATLVLGYLLLTLTFGVALGPGWEELGDSLITGFVDGIGFHIAVFGLFGAWAVLPWRKWMGRDGGDED